jgi:hypothetical protein
MTLLPHLAGRLFGVPLLLARPKLDVLLALLGPRLGLEPPAPWPEVGLLRPHASSPVQQIPHRPGIAVLPIHGTLVRRTVGLEAESGLTSYAAIAAELGADDAIRLAAQVIEVNADFFTRAVLPQLETLFARAQALAPTAAAGRTPVPGSTSSSG